MIHASFSEPYSTHDNDSVEPVMEAVLYSSENLSTGWNTQVFRLYVSEQ